MKGALCALFLIFVFTVFEVPQRFRRYAELQQDLSDLLEFDLQHCPCVRRLRRPPKTDLKTPFRETTCGQDAYLRGSGQHVLSFSFYGDVNAEKSQHKGYFEGIKKNLDLMPRYYPGYIMRLYFDLDANDPPLKRLCELACNYTILDLCHTGQLPGRPFSDARKVFAMIWRFFPTLDAQVDLYGSRDLDGRFSDRELAAVDEWRTMKKAIHVMRDHPWHTVPFLGGLWDADLTKDNSRMCWEETWLKILADPMSWAPRSERDQDQKMLSRYVWPWARNLSVQHDSYFCEYFGNTMGFPTERRNEPNNFVASVVNDNWTLWELCPVACRRKGHPEWEHC